MSDNNGNWGLDGVRLYRQDELDPALAGALSMHQVATITHLPTGTGDESRSVLVLAPGAASVTHPAGPENQLYFVIRGEARLQWGKDLEHSGTAGVGSAVHLPPWVSLAETNSSTSEVLERLLVRMG